MYSVSSQPLLVGSMHKARSYLFERAPVYLQAVLLE